jgi:DNA-binding NarL/FixJ family response regulator
MSGQAVDVVVLAAPLPGRAWLALLTQQPGIGAGVAGGESAPHPGQLRADRPCTVLVDIADGRVAAATRLREAWRPAGVLFLVESYSLTEALALLRAGASGCVSREGTVAELVRGIVAAARGEIVLPPGLAARALAALAQGGGLADPPDLPLSAREAEVVALLAQGLTNKGIAQSLYLSVRTVEAHLRSIYDKLGVRTRTEAALWAVGHGYGEGSVNSPNQGREVSPM